MTPEQFQELIQAIHAVKSQVLMSGLGLTVMLFGLMMQNVFRK